MKALSMMQPYAWLFAHGYLTVDDRTWQTAYRGPLAVHASQRFHAPYYDFLCEHTGWPLPTPDSFEKGGVVGIVQLVACIAPTNPLGAKLERPELRRSHFGAGGHYGLVFEEPRAIALAPIKGQLKLFEVPDTMLARVLAAG